MDANEDYLDSLLNSVLSQDLGGADGGLDNTQQNTGSEAELKEINDVLKKSDQNQMPDAEMLAMLERAGNEMPAGTSDNDVPDVFDIFSSESIESEQDYAGASSSGGQMTDGVQGGSEGEAYLDALLNGKADDAADQNGQPDGEILSLDSLQTEEEPMPEEEPAGEGDFLSLDSLQTEEEPMPEEGPAGEGDFLSLDSLQTEEEPMPEEGLAGEEDFLSLDSLQTEEEPTPAKDLTGGEEDFLSLDSLQSEEESAPGLQNEADMFSLDSLQDDEEMSFGGLTGTGDMGLESSTEEDDEIQREIDELLGLTGVNGTEEPVQNGNAAKGSLSDAVNGEAASNREENKEETKEKKKKKSRFGKKKEKDSAEPAQGEALGGMSVNMGNGGLSGESAVNSGNAVGGEWTADDMSSSAQNAEMPDAAPSGKKQKVKHKRDKAEKQKSGAAAEKEQREPGFFARLLNGLLEEADEEEEAQPQELEVSDENREIMAMMENEKIENKKPGSKKAKKGKKGKADAKQEGDEDGDEEAPVDEKKAKKEKKKKEKKEKKEQKAKAKQEKEQEEKAVPVKKLPKGKVFSIFAFCLTLMAVVVILCFVVPKQRDLKTAREAYYDHDYLTVYQNMDGKDLNDSDYILYMRSKMILSMQGKLDNYLLYMGMNKEMAALNELMLAVHYYQSNRSLAESYGALEELNTVYEQVLSVLMQQYQLSETEAVEIFALDDLSYNERLYYIVYGTEFVAPNVPQTGAPAGTGGSGTDAAGNGTMDDVLPEEGEMIGDDQPQGAINDMPAGGSDTGNTAPSDSWPADGGNESVPNPDGTGDSGDNMPDGQPAVSGGEDQSWGGSEEIPVNGDGGNSSPDAGNEGQPQNTPGESLSQGNGEVLYSGEVQNGNAVLQ